MSPVAGNAAAYSCRPPLHIVLRLRTLVPPSILYQKSETVRLPAAIPTKAPQPRLAGRRHLAAVSGTRRAPQRWIQCVRVPHGLTRPRRLGPQTPPWRRGGRPPVAISRRPPLAPCSS